MQSGNETQPLVGIIMGSKSDWETMRAAGETLTQFGVAHEAKVVSAHRTPDWMVEYASGAEARGLQVIIAGAGGAAHLPGMVAANTLLPVLGVPVESHALKGMDSLLSIVQMPGRNSGGDIGHRQSGRDECGAAGGGDPGDSRSSAAREAPRLSRGTGRPRSARKNWHDGKLA